MSDKILSVGDNIQVSNASWTFGGDVPKTFDSHVSKSVPFYKEGQDLICKYSDYFIHENSTIYDLGTSTAELIFNVASWHKNKKQTKFIGVDREESMLGLAKEKCKSDSRISFIHDEIPDLKYEKSDLILSYYTIQFLKPKYRQEVFHSIFESLNWGGAFILFEKVRAPDARFQDLATSLYNDYKLDQGYNSEEIIAKSRSLKGVLEPFSTEANFDLLKRAGFKDMMSIFKYICFEGIIAIK